ncbi:MAG TPA: rod shape-determining protein RodA [Acidimicrobiales bacterium]
MALSTGTRSGPDRSRRDLSAPWRHVDPVLLVCTIAVSLLGLIMVFSATRGPTDPPVTSYLLKQGLFMAIGMGALVVSASIDYRKYRDWIVPIYVGTMLFLALVVSPLGSTSKGAQSWFAVAGFQIQPSEISKIVLILALASMLGAWRADIDLRRLLMALGVAGVPMVLIMLQPDLGTALVFIAITVAMFLIGGVRGRYLAVLALVGIIGVTGILTSNVLGQYQKDRLTVFLDSNAKLEGPAYNVNQSQAAIANGGVTGSGLFEGPQTRLRYVPEQQTDFIFTALGEQLGFVGGATLLGLFVVIVWRIWRTAQLARDLLGTLICVGVLAMFVFQIFESVGMTMGIMPVTGIPLPFMSYGGSSTVASFVGIGLVLNVHMHRFR